MAKNKKQEIKIKHQFGRRNINDTQKSYLRGLQYENEKKNHMVDLIEILGRNILPPQIQKK